MNSRSFYILILDSCLPNFSLKSDSLCYKNPLFYSSISSHNQRISPSNISEFLNRKMASEIEYSERSSLIDGLINSRNRDLSLFLPFILGLNTTYSLDDSTNPPQDSQNQATPPDRVILVNPLTQGMVVIEASGTGLDSLFRDMFLNKDGQPPASKASIEAMRSVEIVGNENNEECVICLEELGAGQMAKEMPCKHRFHGNCIKKWLEIHGSCPICRYKMPVDDDNDDVNAKSNGENNRGRREIWVSFTINRYTRNGENNQIVLSESNDFTSSHQEIDAQNIL